MGRIVFLNAFSLSMVESDDYAVCIERREPILLKSYVAHLLRAGYDVDCFIRHESTLNAINDFFGLSLAPSSSLYKYKNGDILIVTTLKQPQRGKEVNVASIDDLDFYLIRILTFDKKAESDGLLHKEASSGEGT